MALSSGSGIYSPVRRMLWPLHRYLTVFLLIATLVVTALSVAGAFVVLHGKPVTQAGIVFFGEFSGIFLFGGMTAVIMIVVIQGTLADIESARRGTYANLTSRLAHLEAVIAEQAKDEEPLP